MKKLVCLFLSVSFILTITGCSGSNLSEEKTTEYFIEEYEESHDGIVEKKYNSKHLQISYEKISSNDISFENDMLVTKKEYTFGGQIDDRYRFFAGCNISIPYLYDENVEYVECELFNCYGRIYLMPEDTEPKSVFISDMSVDYSKEIKSEKVHVDASQYRKMVENNVICALGIQVFGDLPYNENNIEMSKEQIVYIKNQLDNCICKVSVNYYDGTVKDVFYKINTSNLK